MAMARFEEGQQRVLGWPVRSIEREEQRSIARRRVRQRVVEQLEQLLRRRQLRLERRQLFLGRKVRL